MTIVIGGLNPLFRFDDISVNTNMEKFCRLLDVIWGENPAYHILCAVSPIVFHPRVLGIGNEERVHPSPLTAMSSLSPYYTGTRCGVPELPNDPRIIPAGHGLMHVDHRLLGWKSQEMSIVGSCALAKAQVFIPPYNKYNSITEEICEDYHIQLIRFEDGWQHALYNVYEPSKKLPRYYMHPYDMGPEDFVEWFVHGKFLQEIQF
jgi:hypothetical protein